MAEAVGPYIQISKVVAATGVQQQQLTAWLRASRGQRTAAGWPVALIRQALAEHGVTVTQERLLADAPTALPMAPSEQDDVALAALAIASSALERQAEAERVAREQAIEAARFWKERALRLEEERAHSASAAATED